MTKVFIFFFLLAGLSAKADTVDNYQIYVGHKLIGNENGHDANFKQKNYVTIGITNYNDTIDINYSHCTISNGKRRITLLTADKQVIAEWNFPSRYIKRFMQISIKQLVTIEAIKSDILYELFYYDEQIPNGESLALLQIKDKKNSLNVATKKIGKM